MKPATIGAALAAVCMAFATAAEGRTMFGRPMACAALEVAVYDSVLRSSAGVAAHPGSGVRQGPAAQLSCRDTARAVSSGFSRAMAERNVYLRWQWPGQESGDLCLSADLSQCYPHRNPFVPFAKGDAAFVADSWNGVLRAVGRAMPRGHAADLARFSVDGLSATLVSEIRRVQRGRAQQAYYTR